MAKKITQDYGNQLSQQIEKSKVAQKTNIAKITSSYNRKVSLKAISSQYDNITQGTFITCYITFENQEEFDKKIATISKKARDLTEIEIGRSMINLMEMAKDPKNEVVLGLGLGIDHQKYLESELGDLSSLVSEEENTNEIIAKIANFEEVEMDAIEQ